MPRPGGEADKLGNRYEGLWVVDAALDLIDDECWQPAKVGHFEAQEIRDLIEV